MMSRALFIAASLLLVSGTADAQKGKKAPKGAKGKPVKAAKACGITAIPLTVGNEWVYEATQHPSPPEDGPGSKLMPQQAKKVTISVRSIDAKDDGTATISLTEDVDGRVLTTTATCTASGLSVSPDSFWFAGEPGSGINLVIDRVERKAHTFPTRNGMVVANEWYDDVKAAWTRTPSETTDASMGKGTIDLKRHYVIVKDEPIASAAGKWQDSAKIGLETGGDISVEGSAGKPMVLPEGLVSWFWLVDGVGPVLVHNSFVQAFQLTSFTIAK
jgi:hypothetical protein